jgi:hypothetical protein
MLASIAAVEPFAVCARDLDFWVSGFRIVEAFEQARDVSQPEFHRQRLMPEREQIACAFGEIHMRNDER